MEILLIGGTGVLSSSITDLAIRRGMSVTIINRGRHAIPVGTYLIKSDCTDWGNITKQLDGKHFDCVIDFLCYTKEQLNDSYSFYYRYASQYIFISSCAVYNYQQGVLTTEESPKVNPIWQYSIDKWACEQMLDELYKKYQCPYTIVRPAVTYGNTRIPYGIYPPYGYHGTFIQRALHNKPFITWNKGRNSCNMMRVEDFAVGLVGLIGNTNAYGEAYNICSNQPNSFREVLNALEHTLNVSISTIDVTTEFYANEIPTRRGELLGGRATDGANSNEKLKKIVPEFNPKIDLLTGVKMTVDAIIADNYQLGIDYAFDAECDRICRKWCKNNDLSTKSYNLGFVNYLGMATLNDRYTYYTIAYRDELWMKVVRKMIKLLVKVKKMLKR